MSKTEQKPTARRLRGSDKQRYHTHEDCEWYPADDEAQIRPIDELEAEGLRECRYCENDGERLTDAFGPTRDCPYCAEEDVILRSHLPCEGSG